MLVRFCPNLHRPFFLLSPRTLKMVTPTQAVSKRPICPSCSKPVRLCLCNRIHNPGLHNSVSVTILQHSFEKKHPLNSARIARLGLKNVDVVTVFDVHFDACFVIRLLDPDSKTVLNRDGLKGAAFGGGVECGETQEVGSGFGVEERIGGFGNLGKQSSFSGVIEYSFENDVGDVRSVGNQVGGGDCVEKCSVSSGCGLVVEQEHEFNSEDVKDGFDLGSCYKHLDGESNVDEKLSSTDFESIEGVRVGNAGPVVRATIGKNGVISSLTHTWMPQNHHKNSQFDTMLEITEAREALAKGFVVQKLQNQLQKGNVELDEEVDELGEQRKRVLGDPLSDEEVDELVEQYRHSDCSRQISLGKGGVTHNMWDDIHNHWKRAEAVRIKCLGVPTLDMDNRLVDDSVVVYMQDKTGGAIIYRHINVLILYLGRNYDPKNRPVIPVMLWKPYPPIYPKLVKNVADGLTFEETKELRNRGLNLLPLMKHTRNGVYVNVVERVKEAFMTEEVVRLNCTHAGTSDCKRIGAKLMDLVPCVPLLFKNEQIILWRGKQDEEQNSKCIHRL